MKCWKCGKENANGVSKCVYCGTNQYRQATTTEVGTAMRQLYDHFGAETLLTNSYLLDNGIGDLVPDSGKVRNQIRMAMDVGVGKLYLKQIQNNGIADVEFVKRVRRVLTEDAELAERAACELMVYFDEMIGWTKKGTGKAKPVIWKPTEEQKDPPAPQAPHEEISKEQSRKKQYIVGMAVLVGLIALIIVLLINNNQNGMDSGTKTIVIVTTPTPERKEDEYYPNGKLKTKYDYDSDGNLQQMTCYDTDGTKTRIMEYNGNSIKIREEWYSDGHLSYRQYFDVESGNVYKFESYNADDTLNMYELSEYYENGNKKHFARCYVSGTIAGQKSEWEYFENGHEKHYVSYNADGTKDFETEYRQTTYGTWQNKSYNYVDGALWHEYDWKDE